MSKITESARNEDCQMRSPVCNFDTETTVFAHLNGAGMGRKYQLSEIDVGCYCCSDCHNLYDRRTELAGFERSDVDLWFYDGLVRTLEILIRKGLLRVG